MLFEFGIVQHIPWTWVTSVKGVQVLEPSASEAGTGHAPEVHTTTASSGEEDGLRQMFFCWL